MTTIVAEFNQKGGIGKSTLSFNTAAAFAENTQHSVLLIDLDPQGNATEGIGLKELWMRKDMVSLYDGMKRLHAIKPMDLVYEVPGEQFFAIPSHFLMMELDKKLTVARDNGTRLLDLIKAMKKAFDIVVIDSPSYFGNLTDNVLRAVGIPVDDDGRLILARDATTKQLTKDAEDMLRSGLVIPIQAEQTSVRASEILFNQIDVVQAELKVRVNQLVIVPNLVQDSRLARRILGDFRTSLADRMIPFDFPKRVVFQEAYELGRTIFTYQPNDKQKMHEVMELRDMYRQLIDIIEKRGDANVQQHA